MSLFRRGPLTDRPTAAVCAVGGPVLLISAALLITVLAVTSDRSPALVHLPWFVLPLLFALAQSFTLNLQVKREARSVSLSDAPFVLGLLTAAPAVFVAARVGGGVLAQVVARRQHREPVKLVFNTVTGLAEAAVGLAVFVAVRSQPDSPRTWLAAVVAAGAANAVSGLSVAVLIARLEASWPGIRGLVVVAAEAVAWSTPAACIGLVATLALTVNLWSAVPLVLVCAALLVGYRAYARLIERHQSLERLYRFSQVVAGHTATDEIFTGMLEQVCDLLVADGADLTFFDREGRPETEVSLRRDQPVQHRSPKHVTAECGWLLDSLRRGNRPLLLARDTKDVAFRHWLGSAGFNEAMIVPLRRDGDVVGALTVIDRMGAARGFDRADLRLLETVANHASIAVRNGELMDRLRHDSLHDALTGIANRTYLQTEIDRLLAEMRHGGAPFAVAMLDLDSFKDVNDTLGHHQGDALLQEVARRLSVAAEGRGLVTRFGGDEFAVLLPGCASDDAVIRHCRTMLDFLAAPVELDGTAIDVGASIGVARAPMHGDTCDELIKRADVAMYVAKQAGRDVVIFDQSQDTASPSRLAMVAALRQAINDGALYLHVQPQLRLDSNEVVSVEALVRWTDTERGVVPPDEFIPLAERSGLIRPLTDFVLERAIEACAAWQRHSPGVAVSVNLSVRSLHDDELDKQIDRILRRHELPGRLLTLEITESSVMADPAGTLGLLHRLRALGVRLSIDDFGTGYSSLSYLRRLPVQEVKVDRAFVQRMDEESDDAAIVRSIVELARTLELTVVAEGVENRRSWQLLAEMGCAMVQGYYLARPMPVSDFTEWHRGARSGGFQRLVAVADS